MVSVMSKTRPCSRRPSGPSVTAVLDARSQISSPPGLMKRNSIGGNGAPPTAAAMATPRPHWSSSGTCPLSHFRPRRIVSSALTPVIAIICGLT